MKTHLLPLLAIFVLAASSEAQIAIVSGTTGATGTSVSVGGVYVQQFNTLVTTGSSTWTDNTTLPGWYAAKGPGSSVADDTPLTSLIANYATPGNTSAGNLYSLAQHFTTNSPNSSFRALGGSPSAGNGPVNLALRFVNNTGSTITGFSVNYEIRFGYSEGNTGGVTGAVITNGGSGYTSAPTVTFSGNATGTAIISGGAVVAVTVNSGGSGYSTAPTVTFSGGGGSGAAAAAIIQSSSPSSGTNTVDLMYKTFAATTGTLAGIPTGWTTAATTSATNQTTSAVPDDWNYVTQTITGLNLAPGQEIWLDWRISKASGSANTTITAIDNVRVADFAAGDPFIVTQPLDQSVITGNSVTFSVVASGASLLTYQWRKNGVPITSATNASYTISTAQNSDIAAYDVLVTSGANSATSNAAKLRVYTQYGVRGPASVNVVTAVDITNGGSGYTSAPTVTLNGGQTSAVTSNSSLSADVATATATVSGGAVTAITITDNGSNYSSAPTVSFSGGGGSGATATATIGLPSLTSPSISYTADATLENVTYESGSAPELGDLYLPNPMPSSLRPAVVIVHGGGGNDGDKLQNREVDAGWEYASRGYVAICINYKRSFNLGNGKWSASWPQNIMDAKSAVRWLRANASTYNIDPNRIGAIGFSWGGNEASMLATTKPTDVLSDGSSLEPTNATDGNGNYSSSVACASDFYGAVTIQDYHNMNQFGGYGVPAMPGTMDYTGTPNYYSDASPAIRFSVNSGAAPMLLIHGDADLQVMPTQSFALKASLQNAGNPVKGVILVPGGLHSFSLYDTDPTYGGSPTNPIDVRPQTFGFFDGYLLPNTEPTITSIANQTVNANTATGAISFTINDTDVTTSALILSGSSSNITLIPNANITFGGSGANRTVTITPTTNQAGTATITVTVSDGTLTASTSFTITVGTALQQWWFQYFGTTATTGTTAFAYDYDGDGLTNLQEYVFGTNPITPNEGNFLTIGASGSNTTLSFIAQQAGSGAGYLGLTRYYTVQTTNDLTSGSWTDVTDYSGIVGANQIVTVPISTSGTKDFYRLEASLSTASGTSTQTTARTTPVGFITLTASAGTGSTRTVSTLGLPLLATNGTSFTGQAAGIITGTSSNAITNSNAGWTAGALSGTSAPYLIQITSGSAAGLTFLISTSATNTATTVTLDSTEPSLSTLPAIATGTDTYSIFPADTISSVFGTGNLTGSNAVQGSSLASGTSGTAYTSADLIQLLVSGAWRQYYYNTSTGHWERVGPNTVSDNVVIKPDTGVIYSRLASSSLNLTIVGSVPAVARQTVVASSGVTCRSNLFPVDTMTLGGTGATTGTGTATSAITTIPGWVTAANYTNADIVQLLVLGAWRQYWNTGTNWRRVGPGTVSDSVSIPAGSSIILNKKNAASGVLILNQQLPYSLQ